MAVIDAHIHFDHEALSLERMLACMERHGIDKAALIAPVCEPFSIGNPVLQASQRMLQFGLTRLNPLGRLLYGTMVDHKGRFSLIYKKLRIYHDTDNAPVFAAVDEHPDRFMAWSFVNPSLHDPVAELEKWKDHPGLVGAKAHPFMHRYTVSLLDPVAAWCVENGRPLLVHLGARAGRGDYRRLPDRYPGLKIVYAHAGIPFFEDLWTYAKEKEGVYVDLSSPYLDPPIIAAAVDYLGADKCLYGTDGPYGKQTPGEDYDYGLIKGWVEALPLPAADREKLLFRNFEALVSS